MSEREIERIKGILRLIGEFPIEHIAKLIDNVYSETLIYECAECAGKGIIFSDGYSKDPEQCEECDGTGNIAQQKCKGE